MLVLDFILILHMVIIVIIFDKETANYTYIQNDAGNTNIDTTGSWDSHYYEVDPYSPTYPINVQQNIVLNVNNNLLGAIDSPILELSSIIYVDPASGNDNNDGSKSSPVKTLSKAYALVSNGGTIFLNEGTYSDQLYLQSMPPFQIVDVSKSVSFVGANREKTIITGMFFISLEEAGYIDLSNLTIKSQFTLQSSYPIMHSNLVNVTFESSSATMAFVSSGSYMNIINCSFSKNGFSFSGAANAYNVNITSCSFTGVSGVFSNTMNNNIYVNYCSFINCNNIVKSNKGTFIFNNSYLGVNDNPSSIANVDVNNWVVMSFENTTELHESGDASFLVSFTKLAHADGTITDLEHPELLSLPTNEVVYTLINGTNVTRTLENLKDEPTFEITGSGTIRATAGGQTLKITIGHDITLNIKKYDAIGYGGEQELVFISNYEDITGSMTVTITGPNYSKTETLDIYGGRSFLTLKDLNAGEYTVEAKYDGDDLYYPQTNSTTFQVLPVDSDDITLKVYVSDINFTETANILVFVGPNGATGNVTITIDGNDTNATLDEKGIASFAIKDLPVKEYTITVKYNGDTNFDVASTTANLKVMPNIIVDELNQTKIDLANKTAEVENLTEQLNQTNIDLANKTAEVAKAQEQVTKLTNDLKTANQKAAAASNNADAKIKKIKAAKSVKKSKKYTITVTLNKKVKGKFVYVSFNGKVYKAKTNAKGIAKVTIKKSTLKKLAGKKIKYQVISGNSLKNKTVKVKK